MKRQKQLSYNRGRCVGSSVSGSDGACAVCGGVAAGAGVGAGSDAVSVFLLCCGSGGTVEGFDAICHLSSR